jgi:hypothetical protein
MAREAKARSVKTGAAPNERETLVGRAKGLGHGLAVQSVEEWLVIE